MKQKLCFHAVKAMLLHGRFRHIAAKNKAVLLRVCQNSFFENMNL